MKPFEHTRKTMKSPDGRELTYYSLPALTEGGAPLDRLPYAVRILTESVLRMQDHAAYAPEHVERIRTWTPEKPGDEEIPFMPARVLLQDFTGVPCVVDLAAMRSALERMKDDPRKIEPLIPVDLVIDHSVQTDAAGCPEALEINMKKEFERNGERYEFLRWGQRTFSRLHVLPPGLGICHQINMEYLAQCVTVRDIGGMPTVFPDTVVGTDSHTVMINSMGVLGWGVGGIEAEAAMLGRPISILPPRIVGVRITGESRPDVTPTDIALTATRLLRETGVVGAFVEYFGPGLDRLSLADRAPIANMAPEYGATMGFFPIDEMTLQYLRETGRSDAHIALVEQYCKEQNLWRNRETAPAYSETVELDLSTVEPSVAGPRRPQERMSLSEIGAGFESSFDVATDTTSDEEIDDGSVVIASITSCTNTSNPSLLIAAGLLARNAVARGLRVPAHVKTSFAPGSRAAADYLQRAGLIAPLEALGFHIVSYGCATCIGNSGPLDPAVARAIEERELKTAAVLSGNRNFEGRIHPLVSANYLCSPPLVVAFALRGTVRCDLMSEPLGTDGAGRPVQLEDIWPDRNELESLAKKASDASIYRTVYKDIEEINPFWNRIEADESPVFAWRENSTYIREPGFFDDMPKNAPPVPPLENARALGLYGDFITTDHISPAGAIPEDGPAAEYLKARGVAPEDFNSFGSRRGNHEVMMRGAFANIRIRNLLTDRTGGWTVHHESGETIPIFDAAMRYADEHTPLIVIAGKMYGAGSSRDWAAKGPALLGVRAVIAESFERIHRSNLLGMGILPLEFPKGESAESLGLTGAERYSVRGLDDRLRPGAVLSVTAKNDGGAPVQFSVTTRLDTDMELAYYRHGGILQYVLRELMDKEQ